MDSRKIDDTLAYMNEILSHLVKASFTSTLEKMALERMTHVLIEAVLDVGNMMIDGFIMRDPGSYEDIINILVDEKVIPRNQKETYKHFISLRKSIVSDYIHVNHDELESKVMASTEILQEFSSYVRAYLSKQLGVANAFLNQKEGERFTVRSDKR